MISLLGGTLRCPVDLEVLVLDKHLVNVSDAGVHA